MMNIVAAVMAAGTLIAGLHWGTFAVGGSDSYCYAHQAERWASGRLHVTEPLALSAPWPSAAEAFAPAGHIVSPTIRGSIAPICPAGLSLAMAVFQLAGGRDAIFLVVPVMGAWLVWSTFLVGRRINARVGLCAALVTACSPVFLFQLMQPMSDVPAAAWWTLAVALVLGDRRRDVVYAGLSSSAAILTRPNLLPLGIVLGLFLLLRPGRPLRHRSGDAAAFALACIPGCLGTAVIQQSFYGSPFGSGYGSLSALFSTAHIRPNVVRYARWLLETETPVALLALIAPVVVRPRARAWLLVAFAVVNAACYLPYVVFEDWWYLRFLLPALPLIAVLMVATIDACAARLSRRTAAVVTAAVSLAIAGVLVYEARDRQVFRLAQLESRYVRGGDYVARRLPSNALVVTALESGSVRYYSGRPTLVWDVLDPAWLDRALVFVRAQGYEPFLLFERFEEQPFRERFTSSAIGMLDWPPMAEIAGQVRIYRPGDRVRYQAGEAVLTDFAR
jgi:hypothetical protein